MKVKFSISTENLWAVSKISFSASMSENFLGQFQASVRESPRPKKGVLRGVSGGRKSSAGGQQEGGGGG